MLGYFRTALLSRIACRLCLGVNDVPILEGFLPFLALGLTLPPLPIFALTMTKPCLALYPSDLARSSRVGLSMRSKLSSFMALTEALYICFGFFQSSLTDE